MSSPTHSHDYGTSRQNFFATRAGVALLWFLAAVGLLLVFEHRAHIFVGNWFWVVLLILCVGMHYFMHGGHGGHGGHRGRGRGGGQGSEP